MARMKKIVESGKTSEKGTKAHRMERKRSETMALKRAKSEPGRARVSTVKKTIKKIREM